MISRLCRGALLCLLAAALVLGGVPAGAVEMGGGTKNFTAPRGVPNYFSNESEPFIGPGHPETGYPRAMVSGEVSRHSAIRGGYRGRALAYRARGRGRAGGRLAGRGHPATLVHARPAVIRGRQPAGVIHAVQRGVAAHPHFASAKRHG